MTKRKIKETVYEYDQDGNVIRKTVTVTDETDDSPCLPSSSYTTFTPAISQVMDSSISETDHV